MNQEAAIQRLIDVVRLQHFSLSTERSYASWLRRFCLYVQKLPAAWSSEKKMEAFLSALAKDDVSASTQNQAFNALLFFYQDCLGQKLEDINSLRAKRGAFIRRAPSPARARAFSARPQVAHTPRRGAAAAVLPGHNSF